jgi:hypothetical protein
MATSVAIFLCALKTWRVTDRRRKNVQRTGRYAIKFAEFSELVVALATFGWNG